MLNKWQRSRSTLTLWSRWRISASTSPSSTVSVCCYSLSLPFLLYFIAEIYLEKQFGSQEEKPDGSVKSVSTQLKKTGQLLADLESVQRERLSRQPEFTLTHTEGPNESETKLAGVIADNLRQLVAQVISFVVAIKIHSVELNCYWITQVFRGMLLVWLICSFQTAPASLVNDHNLHTAMGIVDPASPGDIDLELLREFLTVPDDE